MAAVDRLFEESRPDDGVSRPDDRALVAKLRAGDIRAFELLFHAYFQPLWRFALRYVRASDVAEDLVQTVFEQVWSHRETLTVSGDLRSYLFRAVRNRTINTRKHAVVEARVLDLATKVESVTAADPGLMPDEAVFRAQVRRCVDGLPEPRRTAVILRYYEGLGFAEIADVLGSSVKATEMLVARAVRSLRESL